MRKIIITGLIVLSISAGCSGIPSRLQVEKRKTDEERLEDRVRSKEMEFYRMRGTSRDDPIPGY